MKRNPKILLCSSLVFAIYIPVACTDKPSDDDENRDPIEAAPVDSSAEQGEKNKRRDTAGLPANENTKDSGLEDFDQIDQRSQLASFELEKVELLNMAHNIDNTISSMQEKLGASEAEHRSLTSSIDSGRKAYDRLSDQQSKISADIETYKGKIDWTQSEQEKMNTLEKKLVGDVNRIEQIFGAGFAVFGRQREEFLKKLAVAKEALKSCRDTKGVLKEDIGRLRFLLDKRQEEYRDIGGSIGKVKNDIAPLTARLSVVDQDVKSKRAIIEKELTTAVNFKSRIAKVERKIELNHSGSLVDDQSLGGLPSLMVSAPFQYESTSCKIILALRSSGRSFSRVRFCDNGAYQIDRGVLKLENSRNSQTDFTRDTYPFKINVSQCATTEDSQRLYVFKQTPANQTVAAVTVSERMTQNPVVLTDAKEIASFGSAISCGDLLKKDRISLENDLIKYAVKACDISLKDTGTCIYE